MLFWHVKDAENASSLKVLITAALCRVPLETFAVDESEAESGAGIGIAETQEFREDYDPCGYFPVLETQRVLAPGEAAAAEGKTNEKGENAEINAILQSLVVDSGSRISEELRGDLIGHTATNTDVLSSNTAANFRKDADEATNIFGVNAIMRYIARQMRADGGGAAVSREEREKERLLFYPQQMYGRTPFEAAQVDSWIDYAQNKLDVANEPYQRSLEKARREARAAVRRQQQQQQSPSARRSSAAFGGGGSGGAAPAISATAVAAALKNIKMDAVSDDCMVEINRVLGGLELFLSIRTYLVGERLSLADIAVALSVHAIYRSNQRHGDGLAKRFAHVYRHYNTVMRHPVVREVMRVEGATIGPLRP